MEYDGGDSYNGEWVNGHSEGHGVYTFGEGSHYTGQFRAGLSEGYGAYESSDGEFRLGMWKNDKEDGPMRFMDLVSGDIWDIVCSTAIQLKFPAEMTDILPRVRRGRYDIFQVSLSSYISTQQWSVPKMSLIRRTMLGSVGYYQVSYCADSLQSSRGRVAVSQSMLL